VSPLWIIVFSVVFVLVLVAVVAGILVLVFKKARTRSVHAWAANDAYAAQFGLRREPALRPPWVATLPGERGRLTFYAGERGGMPVALAYYQFDESDLTGSHSRWATVAAVRLPAAPPPQYGPCRFGQWYTVGPDLVICVLSSFGSNFEFPWVMEVLDELVAVAGRLRA